METSRCNGECQEAEKVQHRKEKPAERIGGALAGTREFALIGRRPRSDS